MRSASLLVAALTLCSWSTAQQSSPAVASDSPGRGPNQTADASSRTTSQNRSEGNSLVEESDRAPEVDHGFSYLNSFTGTHSSAGGWSTELTNSVHYDFNKHWSVELGLPVYLLHSGTNPDTVVKANETPPLDTTYNALGDVVLTVGFALPGSRLGYNLTLAGTGPSGSRDTGISTGRPTFDMNNHFEHDFHWLTPILEIGFGDSSSLINKQVRRPYTTLGPMAHAKVGVSRDIFRGWNFEVDGYENMPVANQTIYSRILRRSKNGKITRLGKDGKLHHFQIAHVAVGQSLAEDNGISPVVSKDISQHLGLTVTYDRSFRQHLDTLAMELSFTIGHKNGDTSKPNRQ